MPGVGPGFGPRRGRLHEYQNTGFGPPLHSPFTLTAQIRRGVSIDPRGMQPTAPSYGVGASRRL